MIAEEANLAKIFNQTNKTSKGEAKIKKINQLIICENLRN